MAFQICSTELPIFSIETAKFSSLSGSVSKFKMKQPIYLLQKGEKSLLQS